MSTPAIVTPQNTLARVRAADTERDRILALPVKPSGFRAPDLTAAFKSDRGTMSLREVQSEILYWAWKLRQDYPDVPLGMLISAGVGAGKTLATYLLPLAAGLERPVLLVPAKLRDKTHLDFAHLRPHWKRPPQHVILAYEELSSPRAARLLDELKPDGVICDEVHALKNVSSARTKRALRYYRANLPVRWYDMSGTLTDAEVQNLVHLAEMTHRELSPLPRNSHFSEVMAWAQVLDVDGKPGPSDYGFFRKIHDLWSPTKSAWHGSFEARKTSCRKAYHERLKATPGVVVTTQASWGGGLELTRRRPTVPKAVKDALEHVANYWETPDGSMVFSSPREIYRYECQLACGFWYRHAWEKVRDKGPDAEWLQRKRGWAAEARAWLTSSKIPPAGLDSEKLFALACAKGDPRTPESAREAWAEWAPIRDRWTIQYEDHRRGRIVPQVAVWISEFLIDDALAWAEARPRENVILWYHHRALASAFRRRKGVTVFDKGQEPPQYPGMAYPRVAAMSMRAHGTGKNLQFGWAQQLFTAAFPNAGAWQQALGRTHRTGQVKDEVQGAVNVHTPRLADNLRKAIRKAEAAEVMDGEPQKLLLARWLDEK